MSHDVGDLGFRILAYLRDHARASHAYMDPDELAAHFGIPVDEMADELLLLERDDYLATAHSHDGRAYYINDKGTEYVIRASRSR